ncbi:extracellular solute-binding protein [Thermaerobacter sp. FW80]|uniref:sugar ABC transporter substrate-binding protein n=1 Tax=Thermaerobacter sp. FW80 TaxID=2546351 RepID=UPI0010753828|nr:sugar ABC transporter substrate-binding protein [Thermaerobacter sp. FW80]QBS37749.1 extracellular solute-binding protein [Thermaerobacter sp. FW80]
MGIGRGRRAGRWLGTVLVLVLLALAGCGSGTGSAPGGGGDAGSSSGAEGEDGQGAKTKLTVWIMPNSPQPDRDFLTVIQPFLNRNPGLDVEVTVLDWGSAWTKITTAATSGEGPDVLQLGTTWVPALAAMGALVDIQDRVAEIGGSEAYHPASWNTTGIAGQDGVYAVPWFVDVRAAYYRTDAFAAAGVDPEEAFADWDRFHAALRKVHGVKVGGQTLAAIGFPGKNDWNVAHNIFPWVWGAGGSELTPDLRQAAFNSPAALRGVMFYTGLAHEGLVPKEVLEKNSAEVEALFANGRFAVTFAGPWLARSLRTPQDQGGLGGTPAAENFAVAPMPAGPAGRFTFFGGSNLAIFKGSRHPDAAWELIKFLSTPEAQIEYASRSGMMPAVTKTWTDPKLADDPVMAAFVEAARYGRSYPAIPAWGPMETVLVKHFGMIWDIAAGVRGTYSAESIQAELDAAAQEVNQILQQSQ